MKRRQFLSVSALGGSAVLLSQCSRETSQHQSSNGQKLSSTSSGAATEKVHTSADGLLELDLEASYQTVNLGGKPAKLATYNGQMPGPRLEAKPGDTVRIRFTNNLPEPTNIHYHGLNISHAGSGDNVFLDIQPGETFNYEFTIPEDHPAGTFWYHPHRHGHVADQVFAGLSGFFIIRSDLDNIPEIKAASEIFLALKDFELDSEGNIASPDRMAQMMGREGQIVTADGQVNPAFSISQNGLLRLRLLNASISRFYRLQLEQHSMHLIATDGGALSEPVEIEELLLTPGERAEVLIRGDRTSGSYRLLNLPYNRGGMGMMDDSGMGRMQMGGDHSMPEMNMPDSNQTDSAESQQMTLATLTYSESPTAAVSLPAQLIPVEALPPAQNTRRIELGMRMSFMRGMAFTLNGKTYDESRMDIEVPLGTVEEWEIANVDSDKMDHPFHLHAAPFQVVSRNGQSEPYLAWKDTVLVKGGETVRIRVAFKDFANKSVYHCHILDHEELGMMGVINVTA